MTASLHVTKISCEQFKYSTQHYCPIICWPMYGFILFKVANFLHFHGAPHLTTAPSFSDLHFSFAIKTKFPHGESHELLWTLTHPVISHFSNLLTAALGSSKDHWDAGLGYSSRGGEWSHSEHCGALLESQWDILHCLFPTEQICQPSPCPFTTQKKGQCFRAMVLTALPKGVTCCGQDGVWNGTGCPHQCSFS